MDRQDEIRSNYAEIKENLKNHSGGREVTLLAATKTVSAEDINFAIRELGLRAIGENRVPELLEKYDAIEKDGVEIHFIGTLQKNKVKYIIDKVDMIESVDSYPLALEISRQAEKHGRIMDVLVEINIGCEESKGGVMPQEAENFCLEIERLPGIRLRGIMTMAPKCNTKEEYRKFFGKTYGIFLDISQKKSHNILESVLSMGMSDSYTEAADEGATEVRVGSALFGARKYVEK